jgi:hypothetical protein
MIKLVIVPFGKVMAVAGSCTSGYGLAYILLLALDAPRGAADEHQEGGGGPALTPDT